MIDEPFLADDLAYAAMLTFLSAGLLGLLAEDLRSNCLGWWYAHILPRGKPGLANLRCFVLQRQFLPFILIDPGENDTIYYRYRPYA